MSEKLYWKLHKDTIIAKEGYKIRFPKNKLKNVRYLFDGENLIMIAEVMELNEFEYELLENECFRVCEVFTTLTGNKYIYCRDEEADIDYLVKVND